MGHTRRRYGWLPRGIVVVGAVGVLDAKFVAFRAPIPEASSNRSRMPNITTNFLSLKQATTLKDHKFPSLIIRRVNPFPIFEETFRV